MKLLRHRLVIWLSLLIALSIWGASIASRSQQPTICKIRFSPVANDLAGRTELIASEPIGDSWHVFRGDAQATGVALGALPDKLVRLWRFRLPEGSFDGTAAITNGRVNIGDTQGTLLAFDLITGKLRWHQKAESGFTAAPAVRDRLMYICTPTTPLQRLQSTPHHHE